MFEEANTRAEWLALLFGRAKPAPASRAGAPLESIIAWIDSTPSKPVAVAAIQRRLQARVARYGIPFDSVEEHNHRAHSRRVRRRGMDIKFTTTGADRGRTTRAIATCARARSGRQQASFMATEELSTSCDSFNGADGRCRSSAIRRDHALAAIGDEIEAGPEDQRLYTSNVEQYLLRDARSTGMPQPSQAPARRRTVMIRSYSAAASVQRCPDGRRYGSTQLGSRWRASSRARGAFTSYADVVAWAFSALTQAFSHPSPGHLSGTQTARAFY